MIELADLFDLMDSGGVRPRTFLQEFDVDGYIQPEAIAVATCSRCGALVPDDSADIHLAWHRKIEGN